MAALGIGGADLFGRRVVNASGVITASIIMQVVGLVSAGGAALIVASEFTWIDMGWGLLSGVGLAIGLASYYAGITRSSSTIVSPIVATLSSVIPYIYTLVRGSTASTVAAAGAAVAFVGLAIVALGSVDRTYVRAGVLWGVLSGLGYAFGVAVMVEVADASGAFPAVAQRVSASVVLITLGLVTGVALWPPQGYRVSGSIAGLFTGLTAAFYLIGFSVDAPPTVVTGSMFPIVTVLVGFVFFGDSVSRRQFGGIGLVLAGVAAVVGG